MRELVFATDTVKTLDNDGDVHESDVTYAHVAKEDAGSEVLQRNGEARVLREGEVVVREGNVYDVYSRKQWEDMWNDSERVVDESVADDAPEDATDETDTSETLDSNAPKDDVTPIPPAKKATASRGTRK